MIQPEDLRPTRLADIIGQPTAIRVLTGLVEAHRAGTKPVPHLLFTGPSGTGKSTAALAFSREVLGYQFDGNFVEMNASKERKIEDVRETIDAYVGRLPAGSAPFKILFLDEADEMTPNAQAALRRMMEEGSDVTRFILACNHPTKVIPALHSRCLTLPFPPLSDEDVRRVLASAAEKLGLHPDAGLIDSIVAHADGAARDAVNALIGGDDQSRRWAALDERIRALLAPAANGTSPATRVEPFVQFLRQEGFSSATELEQVADVMVRIARKENLVPEARLPQFVETVAQHARWYGQVAVPLLQTRSMCYGALKVVA